jgi:metal-responsive CopG/Arc/MetJ family transcriptional regulator
MGVVKIAISLPHSLLEQVDLIARRRGQSRSEFVRRSLERAITEEVSPYVLAEARARYAAIDEDDKTLAEDFLAVAAETLPPYDEEPRP